MRAHRNQVNLHLSDAYYQHLKRMAAEAKVKPGALAKSMLEALIDDDAKAHAGKESA